MADSRTRIDLRLAEDHPALIPVAGMTRQARIKDLVEKGLLYEEDNHYRLYFYDCVETIKSLLSKVSAPVNCEPVLRSTSEVDQNHSKSPTKEEQAIALAKSFGIDFT